MGALPTSNLSIYDINREGVVFQPWYSPSNFSMSGIGASLAPYVPALANPYAMSSYLGWQLPVATVNFTQNDGGIWDGCNFWDTWCDIYADDPNWNGQGPFYGGFMYNTERGYDNGTFLTFGGGTVNMTCHARNNINISQWMEPKYTPPCTPIYMEIRVNGTRVACAAPNPYDYTQVYYSIASADPGATYNIACNVLYGAC